MSGLAADVARALDPMALAAAVGSRGGIGDQRQREEGNVRRAGGQNAGNRARSRPIAQGNGSEKR